VAITNGQSRETGKIDEKKDKTKHRNQEYSLNK